MSDIDDICTCECSRKYEYSHTSDEEESSDEVEVPPKQETGQIPRNEQQYLQYCNPLPAEVQGSDFLTHQK